MSDQSNRKPSVSQLDTLRLVSKGYTYAQIASISVLSKEAVRSRVRKARTTMKAKNKTHAVAIAIREGWI